LYCTIAVKLTLDFDWSSKRLHVKCDSPSHFAINVSHLGRSNLKHVISILAIVFATCSIDPTSYSQSRHRTIKVIVLNYDPVLRTKGNARLHEYMKWFDPHVHTANIVKHLREASGGFADYKVVEDLDVNAFPEKRDGFNYTEQSFLEMWADRNKAHQPDTVSYAAIFKKFN